MRIPLFVLFCCICTTSGYASGWNDYSLPIDTDYEIVRCNSLDVLLCKSGGNVILSPTSFPDLGPIYEYAVTPTHIFTRHFGRTPRNLFAGDTFENVDTSQTWLCITKKADDSIGGPFTQSQFDATPEVQGASVDWKTPQNPNIVTPLIGTTVFLFFVLILKGWPIIAVLLIAAIVGFVIRRKRVNVPHPERRVYACPRGHTRPGSAR